MRKPANNTTHQSLQKKRRADIRNYDEEQCRRNTVENEQEVTGMSFLKSETHNAKSIPPERCSEDPTLRSEQRGLSKLKKPLCVLYSIVSLFRFLLSSLVSHLSFSPLDHFHLVLSMFPGCRRTKLWLHTLPQGMQNKLFNTQTKLFYVGIHITMY